MSALGETLLTALLLSTLAACCLKLLPRTPPRVRFAIAAAGLAAWIVPWGSLRLVLPSSAVVPAPLVEWLDSPPPAAVPTTAQLDARTALGYAVIGAFLAGMALFVSDCIAMRRSVRAWRACSRPGGDLRTLLPAHLAEVAADIRIVAGSTVAAASGVLKPTIWLGDRHSEPTRTLALVHEMWHVRSRDPLWLGAIAAVRRLYWWNPLVAHLARQAVLMLESTCDHRCAAQFGKADYAARLAALLLAGTARAPRLVATIGNLDVQRLRLLDAPLRLRGRDLLLVASLAAAGTAVAATSVIERESVVARSSVLASGLPATPAGDALAALLSAANSGNTELLGQLLGAYTPQELASPLPRSPNVRVVDVLHSEPLRIEYVVEGANGLRHIGELTLAGPAATEIAATRLRPAP